jgi:chromosome segregation and condensation protein ScpB
MSVKNQVEALLFSSGKAMEEEQLNGTDKQREATAPCCLEAIAERL